MPVPPVHSRTHHPVFAEPPWGPHRFVLGSAPDCVDCFVGGWENSEDPLDRVHSAEVTDPPR